MITLKESIYKQKLRHIISESDVHVPISRPMWDRILGTRERIKALHLTDFDVYKGILDHHKRGSSAQFSFMARITTFSVLDRGIATKGGIVFECTGYPVLHAGSDVYTEVDSDGMRWIPAYNLFGNDDATADVFIKEVKTMLHEKWIELGKTADSDRQEIGQYVMDAIKHGRGGGEPAIALLLMELPEGPPPLFDKHMVGVLGKMQYEVIKHYMEKIEILVKKYIDIIKREVENRLIIKQEPKLSMWDEVILSDIQIENCYFMRDAVNDILDTSPRHFLQNTIDDPEEHVARIEKEIEVKIGKSLQYVEDHELPRYFSAYLDKGEALVKENFETSLKDYVQILDEGFGDFAKGFIAAHLANWGIGEVQKFISGKGIGKREVKRINSKFQLDLHDWALVLKEASSKEKMEIARECKDINILFHMAFNWAPFNNDIKMIRREVIKNDQFVHQLKLKLLNHIAPFDVHNRKRIYKHPEEYDNTLEKKLRKLVF